MLRPEKMEKIRIAGPKKRLEETIDKLHQLESLHFEEETRLGSGKPYPVAEELSELVVKARSVLSKLPVIGEEKHEEKDISELERRVEKLFTELEREEETLEQIKEKREKIGKLRETVPEELITEYRNLDIIAGDVDDHEYQETIPEDSCEIFTNSDFIVIFSEKDSKKEILRSVRNSGFTETDITEIKGESLEEQRKKLLEREEKTEEKIRETKQEIDRFGEKYGSYIDSTKKELEEELEKAEAPIKFSTTESAFIGEGWVPAKKFDSVKKELENVTGEKIHVEKVIDADKKEAPVEYNHPGPVKPFETLLEMYSTPSYTEIDPTFILSLTFPLFYGIMLSDFGYGVLTFLIFGVMRMKGTDFNSMLDMMLYASASTMVFGLLGGTAFGVPIFGPESVLGLEFFRSIPIILDFQKDVMTVIILSMILGAVQLNLGILIGFYNNLKNSGIKSAVLKNASWLVFEASMVLFGTNIAGITRIGNIIPAALALTGAGMYIKGEGTLGTLDLVLMVTDVLSYIRLMALGIATVSIATVINLISGILFSLGPAGIIFGALVLVGGHVFNIAFQVLGSSLHSLRLNFVEFFDKFYEGGGEKFRPFGEN